MAKEKLPTHDSKGDGILSKLKKLVDKYNQGKIKEEEITKQLHNLGLNEEYIDDFLKVHKIPRRTFLKLMIGGALTGVGCTPEIQKLKPSDVEASSIETTSTPTHTPTPTLTPTETPTPEPISIPTPERKLVTTRVIYHGPYGTKKVAVTFDDTPNPDIVETLSNFALDNQIKLVFFVVGRTTSPEAIRIINSTPRNLIRVGNHSFSHNIRAFESLNPDYIQQEITAWESKMIELGLQQENLKLYFRPPGGAGGYRGGDSGLLSILSGLGYPYLCMWDIEFIYTTRVNQLEYSTQNIANIMRNGIRQTQGGNLVLCHFNWVDTEAALRVIKEFKDEGYEFVFPEELF